MAPRPSVLITGCSEGGIGYHVARAYWDEGYRVFATARKLENIKGLSELGIETFQLDVTDLTSVRTCRDQIREITGGKLDILVNNAGIASSGPGPAVEVDIELARSVFDTNVLGTMRMCNEFVDLLIAARGQILNLGSVVALLPLPFSAAFNASKAAIHQYSDTLRLELQPFGVNVVTVITGTTKTKIWSKDSDLSPDSRYYAMNDQYVAHFQNEAGAKGGTDVDVYARWLVSQTANKRAPGWIYKSQYSTRAWLMSWLLPRSLVLSIMSSTYGIDKLAEHLVDAPRNKDD